MQIASLPKSRHWISTLAVSAVGFASWLVYEGASPAVEVNGEERLAAHIPTRGDVPTIGHGSTRYEDGTPVRLGDAPITRERAVQLARALMSEDERRFRASLPGVALHQEEYDLYLDFTGQYGIGNWRQSSMRRHLLRGEYRAACDALLRWRFQAGRDCRLPANWGPGGCKGVWTRQQDRHARCLAAQD